MQKFVVSAEKQNKMVVAVDSKWQIWGRKFESFMMFE